ncbi:hypothetical protein SARC_05658 [Sphaeroforma arctica JP610]|uniref:Uncharacterized protein n=1 Tax=Sphaeroforma arctica JP610 TaxID=667725 RepID=A0A0L0FZP5_9EUKA|nr:hypothetical protein SARC_05658 [Sphaeroforma arctica JP610]KNC82041.1 hypothetical protein SARC_05658 [Sphaeroforma arctica JP610]|eukprot:XP_014155943.1 hypothetical protein SARC_05658 [Sphaeroforma arctica JP610]
MVPITLVCSAGATWLLPFDGNCFMTKGSWDGIKEGFKKHGCDTRYITVPMARLQSNDRLLDADFAPEATEEPQIIFRHDAKERFNVMMRYGRRPKVELLWRLKVAGPWDRWPQSIGPWEKKEWEVSDDVGEGDRAVPSAGWIPSVLLN